jgi:hypothetical protein
MGRTFKFICTEQTLFSALQKAFRQEGTHKVIYQGSGDTRLEFHFISVFTAAEVLASPATLAQKNYIARIYLKNCTSEKVDVVLHYLDGLSKPQRNFINYIQTGQCEQDAAIHAQVFADEQKRVVLPRLKREVKRAAEIQALEENIQRSAKIVEEHVKTLERGYSLNELDYIIMHSNVEHFRRESEQYLKKDENLIASLNMLISKVIICENLLAERVKKAHQKQSKDLAYAVLPRLKEQQKTKWTDIAAGAKAQTGSPLLPSVQRQMLTQADSPRISERVSFPSLRVSPKIPIDSPIFSARSEQSPISMRRQVLSKPLAVASLVVTGSPLSSRSPRISSRMPLPPLNSPMPESSERSVHKPLLF